jgi:hypothetical protein
MSQPIKIAEGELAEIKTLQGKYYELRLKMGDVQFEKIELDRLVTEFVEREKQLKEELMSLQKLEHQILDKIIKTYGEGSLNMTDGTFTPTQVAPPK